MRNATFLIAGAISLIAFPSLAQNGPSAPAKQSKVRKICRGLVPTGSIMAKRVCLTKQEWTRFDTENERHSEMAINARNNKPQPEPIPKAGQ